jgi:phosphoserine phosphatase
VKNTLVLIGALDDKTVQRASEILWSNRGEVGTPDWLAPGIACEIPFDGPAKAVALPGVDAVVLPTANRRKRLLVADMESTMIENEMLDELADFLGLRERIAGITARAMNGELDFAAALNERVALLKGLPVGKLDEAAKRIRYTPGGATLVATMKKLGFDLDAANVLKHDGRTLAGAVELPILGKEAKLAMLDRLCIERGLQIGEALTVGDGANDLPMLKAAGLGVAFHAKPVVAAEVSARIDHGDLTALLYLQGYRRSEFVERPDP